MVYPKYCVPLCQVLDDVVPIPDEVVPIPDEHDVGGDFDLALDELVPPPQDAPMPAVPPANTCVQCSTEIALLDHDKTRVTEANGTKTSVTTYLQRKLVH